MNQSVPQKKQLSRTRELLFKSITLLFPVVFLLLLEGILRLVSYGDNLNLFIPNPREGYEPYQIVNPSVGKKYFKKLEHTAPANDIFLREKPDGTFRIFVMGSSTVFGFPYKYNLMFSRILHKRLEDAFPDRNIEMVNTAITAINSYTLRDFADQIIPYEPDAILIYAGHNEFYGAFGMGSNESMSKSRALTGLHLWFMDLRFYQLFRNIAHASIGKMGSRKQDQVHGTLMKRIVGNSNIPYGGEDYQMAMTRYRQNMEDVIREFTRKGVPVFLSEVVSNVKDIKPLSSVSTGSEDEAWDLYARAVKSYNNAEFNKARQLFNEAKDMDGVRFRASGEVNRIIHELSKELGTYHIPMLDYFQAGSPHGITGNSLFTEHVHPNIEGQFLMADAFFGGIIRSGLLGDGSENVPYPSAYYKENWGYTELDSLVAHHQVANLQNHWPFVPPDATRPDYRLSYRPVSREDSISFNVMRDPDQYLDVIRLELAREYEKHANHYAAYREYEALLRTNPYLAVNYRNAATSLINLGHLPLALKYFKKSLQYRPSFYASYRIGEIYMIKGDYASAVKSFETAFRSSTENSDRLKALGKLYQSCVYGDQEENARAIAQQLKEYNPGQDLQISPKTYTYNRYIPYKTRNQVKSALQQRSEGKLDQAISTLENSLIIYDSHIAQRLLGEIHLQAGNLQKAMYHLDRVHDEFSFDPDFRSLHAMADQMLQAQQAD